mgnify:CR=1 FL=1
MALLVLLGFLLFIFSLTIWLWLEPTEQALDSIFDPPWPTS